MRAREGASRSFFSLRLGRKLFFVKAGKPKPVDHRGGNVGHRFRGQDGQNGLGGEQAGQEIDQRDEKQNLSKHGEKEGAFRVPQGDVGLLAGVEGTVTEHSQKVDPQHSGACGQDLWVRGKDPKKDPGGRHDCHSAQEGPSPTGGQLQAKDRPNPVHLFGAIVIAQDGLRALGKAVGHELGHLPDTIHHRHDAYRKISPIGQKLGVEGAGEQTFGQLHNEGRDPQRHDLPQDGPLGEHIA